MTCNNEPLVIIKGKTASWTLRWEDLPFIYKPITGITRAGGAVVTAVGHGVPDGWRVAVVSAGGMREINAKNWPLQDDDFHPATVLSSSTIELNDVNSTDYRAWTSGGYLVYYTPVSLAGATAAFQIRDPIDSATALVSITQATGIAIDDTSKTITITLAATATDDYDFETGEAELEITKSGVVTQLLRRSVVVEDEVVRP